MSDRVDYFESYEDRDRNERLLIGLNIGELPSNKDSQGDQQDQAAKDISDDLKWM